MRAFGSSMRSTWHGAIPRFAALGVIPSMQPYHAIDDGRWAEKRVGPERLKDMYPFRSLLVSGAALTFGSDWSVAPLDPIAGIDAAVTRRTIDGKNPDGWQPQERIGVGDALRAYTSANAYAGFQEDRLGRIAPGQLADFVVLSQDIFLVDPKQIGSTTVLRTVVGGKERYRAPARIR
jgi:predicted amidohydrolase YtcJ